VAILCFLLENSSAPDSFLFMLEHNNYRNWITHLKPRLVLVDGISIRDQIVGNSIMSHEVCVVAMRRLGQIDKANNKEEAGMCWRKYEKQQARLSWAKCAPSLSEKKKFWPQSEERLPGGRDGTHRW
jgi:hypothetical protein